MVEGVVRERPGTQPWLHTPAHAPVSNARVIEVNVLTDAARVADISEGVKPPAVDFTYSVKWTPTTITCAGPGRWGGFVGRVLGRLGLLLLDNAPILLTDFEIRNF